MSFFSTIGNAGKAVGNLYGNVYGAAAKAAPKLWRDTLPYTLGTLGGAVGGPLGASAGSTIGGMVKRGHVDLGADAMNFGTGLVGGSIMSKLGGNGFLGTGPAQNAVQGAGEAFTPGSMAGVADGGMGGLGSPSVRTGLGIADAGHSAMSGGGMGALGQGAQAVGGDSFWNGKNISAIGNLATGAMGAYSQNQQQHLQQQQYNDQKSITDEQRQRSQAMDPARLKLLAALFQRLGVSPQAAA